MRAAAAFRRFCGAPTGRSRRCRTAACRSGMFDNPKMSVSHAEMRQGDLFFLYTDGVTEASDANEIQFGDERLFDLLAGGNGATAAQWVARVEYAVRDFARGKPQFDDITCLALKR
jgi:serine phosphatase RsbU (regulator of sigma subunit)